MDSKRPSLSEAQAMELLTVPPKNYDAALLREWFSHGEKREPKFPANASLMVPQAMRAPPPASAASRGVGDWDCRFAPNWGDVRETTPGRVVANSLIFSRSEKLRRAMPFYNVPWDKKVIGGIQQTVVDSLIEGRIDYEDVEWTINAFQWLGYATASYVNPSTTMGLLRPSKRVRELKKKLIADNREALDRKDLNVLTKIEKELIAASEEDMKSDPGYEIYASGARGTFSNNFKNTALMRGAIKKSDDPSQIHISTASLEEGTPADETHVYADLLVQASYGRSVMTQQGGYLAKQMISAFQGVSLDPNAESDCGSTLYLRVTIDSPKEFMYRFVKQGATLVEITLENRDSFKGKTVDMRSPLYCGLPGLLCSRCAGTLYHRMGIENIGLLSWRAGSSQLNAALKAFHDATLKLSRIKLESYIKEVPPQQQRA